MKVRDIDQPFRVIYTNGDIVKGFLDLKSAEDDAKERNQRAIALGLWSRYLAQAKPLDHIPGLSPSEQE